MSSIRNIAPPVLPVPQETYSVIHQNLTNSTLQQFGARASNAVNQLLQSSVPQTAQYSAQFTFSSGLGAIYRVNLDGDITINPPQSSSDGDTTILWLVSGGSSRTVTLNSSIVVPSTITGATPLTIALGKKAVYTVRYDGVLNGGQWELVSFQNGY